MEANLRELLGRDPIEGTAVPIYPKDLGAHVMIMGEEGDSILAVSKPLRVIVPLARYSSEADIQVRIGALFESYLFSRSDENPISQYRLDEIDVALRGNVINLRAILTGPDNHERIASVFKDVPVYSTGHIRSDFVFGLAEPQAVGIISTHTDGREGLMLGYRLGAIHGASILGSN